MALRRERRRSDPFAVLGLAPDASADQIREARNRLAKQHHPDVGGSRERMQRVNDAAAAALALVTSRATPAPPTHPSPSTPDGRRRSSVPDHAGRRTRVGRDHPSFTVEALPPAAFEALVIVANVLGDVADDDPPYTLDVVLDDPLHAWCRVELVPDGGGSTVSLTVAWPEPPTDAMSKTALGVLDVRDRFVTELNALDWTDDGPRRPAG